MSFKQSIRCGCEHEGIPILDEEEALQYDPITELPFVSHAPYKCECTNDLQLYRRNGRIVYLCSCCVLFDQDERINEGTT